MAFKSYLFEIPERVKNLTPPAGEDLTNFMPATAMWAVAERLEVLIEVQEAWLLEAQKTQSNIDNLVRGFMHGVKVAGISTSGGIRTEEDAPVGGVTGSQPCPKQYEGRPCSFLLDHMGDCIFEH